MSTREPGAIPGSFLDGLVRILARMEAEANVTDAYAIIVAAGRSRRMGGEPKIWMTFQGRPVLEWTLSRFQAAGIQQGVVVAQADDMDAVRQLVTRLQMTYQVTEGGAERYLSVEAGLNALDRGGPEAIVLIHDAARFLVPPSVIGRVVEAAHQYGAALPVVEVADTVKQIDGEGRVEATIPRAALRLAQTPQGFRRTILAAAYRAWPGPQVPTDDAEVVEAAGYPVWTVVGDVASHKLTRPEDVAWMEALIEREGD